MQHLHCPQPQSVGARLSEREAWRRKRCTWSSWSLPGSPGCHGKQWVGGGSHALPGGDPGEVRLVLQWILPSIQWSLACLQSRHILCLHGNVIQAVCPHHSRGPHGGCKAACRRPSWIDQSGDIMDRTRYLHWNVKYSAGPTLIGTAIDC